MASSRRSMLGAVSGIKRGVAVALIVVLSPLLANCYGKFPLTHAVYKANGDIGNGLLRQLVFWAFVIVPVYYVAMLADAVAFNLIDFWFGERVDVTSVIDEQGNTVVLAPSQDGREAVLTVSKDGQTLQQLRFVRASDTLCNVYDQGGALVGRAERVGGELRLTDATGNTVSVLSAEDVALALGR
jgi:hypothetical protein